MDTVAMDALDRARVWTEANRARLLAGLAHVRVLLESHARESGAHPDARSLLAETESAERKALAAMPAPAALETLCDSFALSSFERRVLLLCAGVELERGLADLCAAIQSESHGSAPTFGLALAAFPDAHWSALTPASPLRLWRLVEMLPGDTLASSPLRIDERVLHHLTGLAYVDERLRPLLRKVELHGTLVASHQSLAEQVGGIWSDTSRTAERPIVQLCGADVAACRAVAAAACTSLSMPLYELLAHQVPTSAQDHDELRRLWDREAILSGSTLLMNCYEVDGDALRTAALLAEEIRGPVVVAAREPLRMRGRSHVRFDVHRPDAAAQRLLWCEALGSAGATMNGQIDAIAEHFQLDSDGVRAAGALALVELGRTTTDPGRVLWQACRAQARPRMDNLAQRIEPAATWDDLILPAPQKEILRQIAANVAQRTTVYERWGFGAPDRRGLSLTALFAGASGTGKTMAAEVLGHEIGLDLYRIDLSQVVSKYIGETEKNLSRVFDAAEEGGAVLLFDEADALFGKRSEVRDSHDRYANIEVSYLLQRMEAYRGLAILTTNMKSSIDPAFLRRIRFVIQFPFPDTAQRIEIWRRAFPPAAPTEGIEPERLGRLNVAGGNIRNIAIMAAFIAAAAKQPVRMDHLLRAARAEYAKLEKPLTDAEVAGWR